jgi:hypothetical protein
MPQLLQLSVMFFVEGVKSLQLATASARLCSVWCALKLSSISLRKRK